MSPLPSPEELLTKALNTMPFISIREAVQGDQEVRRGAMRIANQVHDLFINTFNRLQKHDTHAWPDHFEKIGQDSQNLSMIYSLPSLQKFTGLLWLQMSMVMDCQQWLHQSQDEKKAA